MVGVAQASGLIGDLMRFFLELGPKQETHPGAVWSPGFGEMADFGGSRRLAQPVRALDSAQEPALVGRNPVGMTRASKQHQVRGERTQPRQRQELRQGLLWRY